MKKVENIQSILEGKAKIKLEADIDNFLSGFRKNDLFFHIKSLKSPIPNVDLDDWLAYDRENYAKDVIFKALILKYVEQESKLFIEKVENIQSELDELKDLIPNQ